MNKLSRLTALLLALLMLLSSTGVAEAAAGIAFGDFDAAAFNRLSEAASLASEEEEVVYTDPLPLEQCSGTIYDEECFLDAIRAMTAEERMEYVNGLESYYYSHYRTWHEDTKLLCECDFPMLAPGAADHIFENCPWHPNVYVPDEKLEDTEKSETAEDGTTVTVSGSMPEDVKLKLDTVTTEQAAVYLPHIANLSGRVVSLDITLISDESEWQPEESVAVTVSAANIGEDGDAVHILHTHVNADGSAETEDLGVKIVKNGALTLNMSSFSTVTFINCSDEDADICILETLQAMTIQERYEYLNNMYNSDDQETKYLASDYYWHYSYKHEDTKLLCECQLPLLAPGAEGHFDTDCAWHPDNLPVDTDLDKTTDSGIAVTVSGSMPAGAELQVSDVTMSEISAYLPTISTFASGVVSLDISIVSGETEWTPEGEMTVTVDATNLGSDGDAVLVLHTKQNGDAYETEEIGVYMISEGAVTFKMSSFSNVTLVNCSNEDADICILETLQAMTVAERYTYFTELTESDRSTASTYYWHYSYKHEDTKLLCECQFPIIEPGVESGDGVGHTDADCAWHPDNLPVDNELDKTTESGIAVTVSGSMPAGVDMTATDVAADVAQAHLPGIGESGIRYLALDITLTKDGAEWQPSEAVDVTIAADSIGSDGGMVTVLHNHDGVTSILGDYEIVDGEVTFPIDGFSCVYVLNSYTGETCWTDELEALTTAKARYEFLQQKEAADTDGAFATFTFHYHNSHLSEKLICDCDIREFKFNAVYYAPWSSEHTQTDCPWHPNNKPQASQTVDGTTVTVTGDLPDGAEVALSVQDLADLETYLPGISEYAGVAVAYDIAVTVDGAVWQPEDNGTTVSVTLDSDNLGTAGQALYAIHTHVNEDGTFENEELGELTIDENGAVTFDMSRFSTVTFVNCDVEWNDCCMVEELAAMLIHDRYTTLNDMYNNGDWRASAFFMHYQRYHSDSGLICICDLPLVEPGINSGAHYDTTCPWHPDNLTADSCTDANCWYAGYTAADGVIAKYAYLMKEIYAMGNTKQVLVEHVNHYHPTEAVEICTCDSIHAPGSSEHEADCAWAGTVDISEHYSMYTTLQAPAKAFYLLGMDDAQLAELEALMTDEEKEEKAFLLSSGVAQWLTTSEVRAWYADESVTVTLAMLKRAQEVYLQLEASSAYFNWNVASRLEDPELIDVYTGVALADYVAGTNELYDRLTGLYVGTIDADGTIVGPTSFVIGETPTTEAETETTTE